MYISRVLCYQEVEPTIGEALCRLFQPDENIDLRRIAQIARQSLKRRDPSTVKTTVRSESDLSLPPPPGMTESSSSRSDTLLLGLSDDSRTLCQGRARTHVSSVHGKLRLSECSGRTYLSDNVCGLLCCHQCATAAALYHDAAAKTDLGRLHASVSFAVQYIPLLTALLWTLKWTFLNSAAKLWHCMNSLSGVGLSEELCRCFWGWELTFCISDLWTCCGKIPQRTFRPSWTLSALR